MQPTVNCRVCGKPSTLGSTGRVINSYALFSCDCCGTVLVNNCPEARRLQEPYDSLYQDKGYEHHRAEFQDIKAGKLPQSLFRTWQLQRIEALCRGRDMVEIGCGVCTFGLLASKRGWTYTGFDVSAAAVEFAEQLGLRANVMSCEGPPSLSPQTADVVVMWEVIEHIWNLADYLRTIAHALRPGGVFVVSTPNYLRPGYGKSSWARGMAPPIHLNFFTRESLRQALQACGFGKVTVFKNRIDGMSAPTAASALRLLRTISFIEEPATLYGIARTADV